MFIIEVKLSGNIRNAHVGIFKQVFYYFYTLFVKVLKRRFSVNTNLHIGNGLHTGNFGNGVVNQVVPVILSAFKATLSTIYGKRSRLFIPRKTPL